MPKEHEYDGDPVQVTVSRRVYKHMEQFLKAVGLGSEPVAMQALIEMSVEAAVAKLNEENAKRHEQLATFMKGVQAARQGHGGDVSTVAARTGQDDYGSFVFARRHEQAQNPDDAEWGQLFFERLQALRQAHGLPHADGQVMRPSKQLRKLLRRLHEQNTEGQVVDLE